VKPKDVLNDLDNTEYFEKFSKSIAIYNGFYEFDKSFINCPLLCWMHLIITQN